MRVFDSQQKVIWSDNADQLKAPLRLGPNKRVSAEIKPAIVSKIKIIGKKISGDGVVSILIKDRKKAVVLSESFKFTKNSLSEVFFDCNITGKGLRIFVTRDKSANGSVFIERILMEGVPHNKAAPKRGKRNKANSPDYAEMTKGLARRMNLAIIIPYGIYGGGEVYIKNLISNGHKDFNIDVLFVVKNKLIDELEGCPVNIIKLGGLSGLKSRLQLNRYDAVIFYNSKKVYDVLEAKRLKENFSADIIEVYHSDFLWSDAISGVRHRECVDKLFRVSSGLAQDITGIDEQRKICVPVGVNPERFDEKHVWPNDVPKGFERTIGMVARLSPEKNINYAMSLMKSIPEYQLVILGSGPLGKELEARKKSENMGNITFVGYKRSIEPYYSIFDALLLTSEIEGTPISIVEALMCGLPVFTTPVGQIERNYSDLYGVKMLSGDIEIDAESLRSFDYNHFNGDELKAFAINNHGLEHVRDLFFSNILNFSSSFLAPGEGVLVLEGEYI
jgi:glycosyltransferase involved in cell wall biosynthesis